MNRLVLSSLFLLAASSLAEFARADSTSSIVIFVEGEQREAVAERICMELKALGLDARPADMEVAVHSELSTERIATEHGAAAGISVKLLAGLIDVWVADRVTGKNVHRAIEVRASDQPLETIVVVAAVELLRASLMELHSRETPKGTVEPTSELAKFAEPKKNMDEEAQPETPDRFFMELGPAVTAATLDMSPSFSLWASAFIRLAWKLRIGVIGIAPLVSSSLETRQGEVKVTPGFIGGSVAVPLKAPRSSVGFVLGAGAGAALFNMRGLPEEGYVSTETMQPALLFFGNGALSAALTQRLAVRLECLFGLTAGKHAVLVREIEVASLGRPWISGTIVLELAVF